MFYHEAKDADMIAFVDGLLFAGCVYSTWKMCSMALQILLRCNAHALDRRRDTGKWRTRDDESCSRTCGLAMHGDPKHAAIPLKDDGMNTCRPMSSPHVTDITR